MDDKTEYTDDCLDLLVEAGETGVLPDSDERRTDVLILQF
jgi:hypothetical protein